MNPYSNLIIFLGIIVFGVGIEVFLSKIYFHEEGGAKKKHQIIHFKFSRYLFLLSIPLLGVILMYFIVGISILESFFLFALLGTGLEYLVGYCYQAVVGQRLWTYYKYSLGEYTSLLSIPLWGLCGTLVFLLSKVIG
jgi:hypothetical protein